MKDLLLKLQSEGYPLTTVARHSGVGYGKLYRCSCGKVELRIDDADAVKKYARQLKVKV